MRYFNSLATLGNICILFVLPLACSHLLADGVLAPKLAALWFGSSLLFSGFILRQIATGSWTWPNHPAVKLGMASLLWSILCSLVSGFHSYAIPGTLCALLYAAILFIWATALQTKTIWDYLGGFSAVAFVLGLYAHLQRLTLANYYIGPWRIGDFMSWQPVHLAYERTIATMGNPDYFASYLAAILPLALLWSLQRSKIWQKWLCLALWCSSASAMVLTQTRSAWLGAIVSVPLGLYMMWQATNSAQRRAVFRDIALIFLITIACTFGIYQWQKSLHPQLDLGERIKKFASQDDLSIQARYYFWHSALRSALQHPLMGLGSGGHAVRAMHDRDLEPLALRFPPHQMENVHSQLLQTLAENGWPGLLLLAAALLVYARTLYARRHNLLAAGLLSSAVALWVSQLFICSTYQTETLWLFLLGAAARLDKETQENALSDMSDKAKIMSEDSGSADVRSVLTTDRTTDRTANLTSDLNLGQQNMDDELDWHFLYIPCIACFLCIGFTGAAAFLSLRSEYDLSAGQAWRSQANQYAAVPGSEEKAQNCYMRSEAYLMRSLEFAPVWRQAYIYRELGLLVQDMFIKLSKKSDPSLYENARETYCEALRFNAYEPFTYSCLANLQSQGQHLDEALQSIDQALRLDPRNPQYLHQKALLLISTGRYAESRDLAMRSLEYCPQSPYLWHALATAHRYLGEYEAAEQDIKCLLQLDPQATGEAEKIRAISKASGQ
ncbi:MAG: O-antigen ligase family protein [bacterium]|nr:O-antigen ligase family protein [bacterium]